VLPFTISANLFSTFLNGSKASKFTIIGSSLAFAQGLLTMLIWLLTFSIYIVPLLLIAWCVHRWRHHGRILPPSAPKA
jgi:hypothetical protein